MIEALWKKHYHPGTTGNYHGDMALAFDAMSKDSDCDLTTATKMRQAVAIHMKMERLPSHEGRKWFCELFGLPHERILK